jgi:hypothetical protein
LEQNKLKWNELNPTLLLTYERGRAVTQVLSCGVPTAAAQVKSCGICGGQSGTEAGFLWALQFPLPSIPLNGPHSTSSIIIFGWYNKQVVASVIVDSVPLLPKKGEGETKKMFFSIPSYL